MQYFPSSFQLVFETNVPHIEKRVKGRPCPWLDIDTKKLMNRSNQTLRKARKSKSNDDWKSYKTLRNKCNKKIKKAKSNHHKKALNDNINKPKKFWTQIKEVFPGKSQSMANISIDKCPSLNILSRFYRTMASKLMKPTYLLTDFTWCYTPKSPPKTTKTFRFRYISVLFVQKELLLLFHQKSTGIDNLPPELLKDCGSIISKPLCHKINLSIRSGKFPSSWKAARLHLFLSLEVVQYWKTTYRFRYC